MNFLRNLFRRKKKIKPSKLKPDREHYDPELFNKLRSKGLPVKIKPLDIKVEKNNKKKKKVAKNKFSNSDSSVNLLFGNKK